VINQKEAGQDVAGKVEVVSRCEVMRDEKTNWWVGGGRATVTRDENRVLLRV